MDMTPRDSSSLLQSVQGAGHIKNEEHSPEEPTAQSGLMKRRYRPTTTPHLSENQNLQVRAYFSSLLASPTQTVLPNLDRFAVLHTLCALQHRKD